MNFANIIRKNFFYHFKKYLSNFLVNSLIVTLLFLLTSLLNITMRSTSLGTLYEAVGIALWMIVLFSVLFISYTHISFLRYRGKEFGMYITLGMTTKDVVRILFIENMAIALTSILTGLVFGTIFSSLFYLALNDVLPYHPIDMEISASSYFICIFFFLLIYSGNMTFTYFYFKKKSIVDVLKASKKSELGKYTHWLGVVALVLFILACVNLPKTDLSEAAFQTCLVLLIVCPYFIIGSMIVLFKDFIKLFKKTYHNQLLVLSNLTHRFAAYRNTLYLVTLFIAGAVFFVGFSYSTHLSSTVRVNNHNPYNIMYVETNHLNKLEQRKVDEILNNENGYTTQHKKLEYLEIVNIKINQKHLSLSPNVESVISLSNYNKHMKTHYKLQNNQAFYVTNFHQEENFVNNEGIILATISPKLENQIDEYNQINSKASLKKYLNEHVHVSFKGENIKPLTQPFTNFWISNQYSSGSAYIVNDHIYEKLKASNPTESTKILHLIKGEIPTENFDSLIKTMRMKNGLDHSYWNEPHLSALTSYEERVILENYRPISKAEQVGLTKEATGSQFFVMSFISILLILASGTVLYYKVLADVNLERERIQLLKRIGMTSKEIKSLISKELSIIFFIPLLFGMGVGVYLTLIDYFNTQMLKSIIAKVGIIWVLFIFIQTLIYMVSRKKYLYELSRLK